MKKEREISDTLPSIHKKLDTAMCVDLNFDHPGIEPCWLNNDPCFHPISRDDVDEVRELVNSCEDINTICPNGGSVLHLAAGFSSWESYEYLIYRGAEFITDNDNSTVLHMLASKPSTDRIFGHLELAIEMGCPSKTIV